MLEIVYIYWYTKNILSFSEVQKMRGKTVKRVICFVTAALTVLSCVGTCFAAGGANTTGANFLSDYVCDFEGNYFPNQGANVIPGNGGSVYRMDVTTNGENNKFEIYNKEKGEFTVKDGNVYAVTLKYKVENISSVTETDLSTTISIARSGGLGNSTSIKTFQDIALKPGDTTDWIDASVVFKASIADSPSSNKLAINVVSPSCPASAAQSDSEKTTILFDDITVTECGPDTSSLEFQSAGGSRCDVIMGKAGDTVTLPTPERKWYTFDGWYTDAEHKTKFTSSVIPSRITTRLYAKWTPEESAVKLTFHASGVTVPDVIAGGAGEKVSLPNLSRSGFRFSGWYNKDFTQRYSFDTMPAENLDLYARWELIPQYCGFENTTDFSTPNNADFTQRCRLETSDKYGGKTSLFYDFDIGTPGNYRAFAGVLIIDENGNKVRLDKDVEYTVTFKYKLLSFKKEGGFMIITGSSGSAWADRKQQDSSESYVKMYSAADVGKGWKTCTITLKADPKDNVSNYAYLGISGHTQLLVDDIFVYPSTTDVEFKGNMICFDSTGGTYCETIYGEFGNEVILPDPPTREGYTFLGWSTDRSGLEPYAETTFNHGYLMLYADWKKDQVEEPDNDVSSEASRIETVDTEPKKESGNSFIIYIVIVAVVLAAAGAVVAVVLIKKKKPKSEEKAKSEQDKK